MVQKHSDTLSWYICFYSCIIFKTVLIKEALHIVTDFQTSILTFSTFWSISYSFSSLSFTTPLDLLDTPYIHNWTVSWYASVIKELHSHAWSKVPPHIFYHTKYTVCVWLSLFAFWIIIQNHKLYQYSISAKQSKQ